MAQDAHIRARGLMRKPYNNPGSLNHKAQVPDFCRLLLEGELASQADRTGDGVLPGNHMVHS